ncbi:MAG: ImmA/IrrE family metallo-endopeptidase [Ktedonobacteraceae bacterium]
MINGNRVRQVRELVRLTQTELATDVGIAQSTIAHIEGGLFQPSQQLVEAIAARLGFPVSFFEKGDPPNFPLGSLLFRSHKTTAASERLEAYRFGQLGFEVFSTMSKRVRNKITLRLPQIIDEPGDYISAAQLTRDALGLSPDVPIPNLVKVVEQSGAILVMLPTQFEHCDAYSLWVNVPSSSPTYETKRPLIALSNDVPGDRLRLSLAHELGHLIMHQSIKGPSSEIEDEAYKFAAELLLPESAMQQQLTKPVTLSSLSVLKPVWGVSIQALIQRSYELGFITERQRTYLYKQINTHAWKYDEPITIPSEKPRALRQMAEIIYGNPINYQRMAHDLNMHPHLVKRLIDAYATREDYSTRSTKRIDEVNKIFSIEEREPREL